MDIIEVCNIWKCQCNVKLRKDEKICPWCHGQAAKFGNVSFKQRNFTVHQCILCKGEGKVDWIQAITQKPIAVNTQGYPLRQQVKDIKMRCTGPAHCRKKLKRLWLRREDKYIAPSWTHVY